MEFPAAAQRWRVTRQIGQAVRDRPVGWQFRDLPADRLKLFERHLDSLVTAIQAVGAEPVLVTHAMRFTTRPMREDQDLLLAWQAFYPRAADSVLIAFDTAAARVVREVGERRRLRVVDAAARMSGRTEWFADFTHFTETGAAVMAGLIASALSDRATLPKPTNGPVDSLVNPVGHVEPAPQQRERTEPGWAERLPAREAHGPADVHKTASP